MNSYSGDLRKKIFEAFGQGMGRSEATCTFSVNLSSVKRYARMAEQNRSLAPKKRPDSNPELDERARRLLEEDLKERPFVTLQEAISLRTLFLSDRDTCVILKLWSAPWSAPLFLLSTEPC